MGIAGNTIFDFKPGLLRQPHFRSSAYASNNRIRRKYAPIFQLNMMYSDFFDAHTHQHFNTGFEVALVDDGGNRLWHTAHENARLCLNQRHLAAALDGG